MRKDPLAPFYKKCNEGENSWKYANLPEFPDLIDIELAGGYCSSACSMCPVGLSNINRHKGLPSKFKRERGFMDKFLFLKILGEIKDHKTPVRFILWGEPTLHPDFWWFVKEAKKYDLLVHINSNGLTLRQLREPIDSIKISLHTNSKKVREGVNALITMNCYRSASITDKEAEDTGIDISKYPFTELDNVKQYRQFYEGIDAPRPKNCSEVFNKLNIFWDGRVTACCNDFNGLMVVGDLHNESLQEIWTGKKIEKYRKLIAAEKHWNLPVCRHCYNLGAITD